MLMHQFTHQVYFFGCECIHEHLCPRSK
jgi:hypothetical protein